MTDQVDPQEINDLLFAEAQLGVETEQFLSSNVGRYLAGRAEIEVKEAQEALLTADPNNAAEVQRIQVKAQVALQFTRWVEEAINNGLSSEKQLEELEEIDALQAHNTN